MRRAAQKIVSGVFNSVGAVSPALAGRMAFLMFTRTRSPHPATEKERALHLSSAPRMAEAERMVLPIRGSHVIAHRFAPIGPPSGKRILFTHGWGSRIAYTQGLVTGLRQAGYEVYALDLPGHGESPGRYLHAGLAIEALTGAFRRFGPFDAMIGHSFGGYMTMLAAHGILDGQPLNPKKIVTIASPADVRHVIKGYAGAVGVNARIADALLGEIERVTGKPVEAANAPALLTKSGIPALVLHAEEDKEVNSRAAHAYGKAGPHVEVLWLNGLGHRRIVNAPEAVEAITRFLGA